MSNTQNTKKPFYKSLTIQGNAVCFVGFAWLIADLLVKPAEMLIADGKIRFNELIPSTIMVVFGSLSALWGRFRKGDLLVEAPKIKKKTKSAVANPSITGDFATSLETSPEIKAEKISAESQPDTIPTQPPELETEDKSSVD